MTLLPRSFPWKQAGLLAALLLAFYWKILFTNQAIFPWDAADYFYPAFAFVHEELRHLRLPWWNPFVLSGYPVLGDIQAQIFYPLNWLFVLLHPFSPLPYRLVEMQVILHFLLAGLCMYLLANEFVESRQAAILAGVLYMLGGAMVARTQHVNAVEAMAWSPLIFLLARRGLLRHDRLYFAAAGMLFGIQLLIGRWQHSVYLGLFLFLYFLYEACAGSERSTLWPHWLCGLLLIAALGAALAMVQIIPAYQLGIESVRAYINYWEVSVGNDPRFLWTLVIPNYLGGINGFPLRFPYDLTFNYVYLTVPGTVLALAGLAATLRRRNFLWLIVLALFLTLSLGNQGPLAGVVFRIPVLNLFRTMAAFFEIAHLALCLLAAIGAQAVLAGSPAPRAKKLTLAGLAVLLLIALGGSMGPWATQLPSWRHATAALLVFGGILAARFANRLAARTALWAVVGLVVFELWFYTSNQSFNSAPDNPATFLSADYAAGRREPVAFLRSDPAGDFRVAALAEYQWTGNGWSLWRIPGITGVNPVALRRYDQYMTVFSRILNVRVPTGGEDHNIHSPLADLLGVKYLVLADPRREAALGLEPGGKYSPVFEDQQWWRIYRNDGYLRRAWFYPKAYALPKQEQVFGLLSSSWFDPRRTLLLERDTLPNEAAHAVEQLAVVPLFPGGRPTEISGGREMPDPYCAQPVPMIGGWGRRGSQLRFRLPPDAPPGRYRLLIRYTANELEMFSLGLEQLSHQYPWYRTALPAMPRLQVVIEGPAGEQSLDAVALPRTFGWPCHVARSGELGEITLRPEMGQMAVTALEDTTLNVYSLWLVRLPEEEPPVVREDFVFGDFSASPRRMALTARLGRGGFVLLNEVYYPAWEARVNGTPAHILPANGLFRALYLPAGVHRIEMEFRPPHFYFGAAVSLLTVLGFLLTLRRARRQRRVGRRLAGVTPPNRQ